MIPEAALPITASQIEKYANFFKETEIDKLFVLNSSKHCYLLQ